MTLEKRVDIPLQAVIYQHEDWWIAHCLEMDLVAQGKTPAAAFQDLLEISDTQIRIALEEGDLASVFRPAPPEFWKMFATAVERPFRRKPAKPVTRFEAREVAMA